MLARITSIIKRVCSAAWSHPQCKSLPIGFAEGTNKSELGPQVPSIQPIAELKTHIPSTSFLDVAAASKVMQVLEKQLSEVSTDIELSVVGVCQGFSGMTEKAQSAINLAQSAVGNMNGNDEGDLIRNMHNVIACLLDSFRVSTEFSQQVSSKLLTLETHLSIVEQKIEEVEEISSRAKLVALNGQIEASRLGAAGRAFLVVAEETKSLAVNAARTSDSIRTSIGKLSSELNRTSSEIKRRSAEDSDTFKRSEESAKKLLNELQESNHRITTSLGQTATIGSELRTDIAKAVMSMQFQDRISQRIAHVIETLEILTKRIDPLCDDVSDYAASSRCSEWMKEITSRYTMDSERNVHSQGVSSSASSDAEDFSVELF